MPGEPVGEPVGELAGYCPGWFCLGLCEDGHRWAKEIICGREWCPKCRDQAQKRRMARWWPKVQELKEMGYLVVTFPPEDRARLRTKAELAEAGKMVKQIASWHWPRGLRRWHFFGERGAEGGYHPHLNLLVDGGKVSKQELRVLRRQLRGGLGLSQEPVINYHYTVVPGKMVHWLKYVCRATFLDRAWDEELAEELYDFRNVACWGKWDGPPAWEPKASEEKLEAVRLLENGQCPICGTLVEWSRPQGREMIMAQGLQLEPLNAGYFRVRNRGP